MLLVDFYLKHKKLNLKSKGKWFLKFSIEAFNHYWDVLLTEQLKSSPTLLSPSRGMSGFRCKKEMSVWKLWIRAQWSWNCSPWPGSLGQTLVSVRGADGAAVCRGGHLVAPAAGPALAGAHTKESCWICLERASQTQAPPAGSCDAHCCAGSSSKSIWAHSVKSSYQR